MPEYFPRDGICLHCLEQSSGDPCLRCGNDPKHYEGDNRGHLERGTVINERYLLGRVLGAGGFGVTYLSHDLRLGGRVAVKEYLPRDYANRDPRTGEVVPYRANENDFRIGLERFREEGEVLGRLQEQPYVVAVHDFVRANGTAFLVMEFVEGQPLDQLLKNAGRPLPEQDVREILSQLCIGLQAVHERGILHRDLKPANLYWTNERQIRILDFGAAKQLMAERSGTLAAVVAPGYAPPEQYMSHGRRELQGPPTDIYGLGATGYALATGHLSPPGLPESMARLVGDEVLVPPQQLRPGKISAGLSRIITKAMEVDRTKRYQSAIEMLNDLRGVETTKGSEVTCSSCGMALVADEMGQKFCPACSPSQSVVAREGATAAPSYPLPAGSRRSVLVASVAILALLSLAIGLYFALRTPAGSNGRKHVRAEEPSMEQLDASIERDAKAQQVKCRDGYGEHAGNCVRCPSHATTKQNKCFCQPPSQLSGDYTCWQCKCPGDLKWRNGTCQCAVGYVSLENDRCCPPGFVPDSNGCSCPGTLHPVGSRCDCRKGWYRVGTTCLCPEEARQENGTCKCPGNLKLLESGKTCGCKRPYRKWRNKCFLPRPHHGPSHGSDDPPVPHL